MKLPSILIMFCVAVSSTVFTTSLEAQDTATKIDRIERQLRALQRRVFGDNSNGFQGTDLPAANAPSSNQAAANPRLVADLSVKLDSVERQLRSLTGRLEEFEFKQRQLEERMDAMQRDVSLQIDGLKQNGASGSAPGGGVTGRDGGTSLPAPTNTPTPAPTVELPNADPNQQYSYAFEFVRQNELDNGRIAMEQFIAANPGHTRIGDAKFWLGRIHLLQKRPGQAAQRFFTLIEEHPNHSRRPDALVDLAQALVELDSASDACNALAEFDRSAVDASSRLRTRADRIRRQASCG